MREPICYIGKPYLEVTDARRFQLSELVRFDADSGCVLVEVAADDYGVERVSRSGAEIIESGKKLEDAITEVRPALNTIVKTLKDLSPKACEIEFGIKLNAEAGVVVAKTAVEGHFAVKLSWGERGE